MIRHRPIKGENIHEEDTVDNNRRISHPISIGMREIKVGETLGKMNKMIGSVDIGKNRKEI